MRGGQRVERIRREAGTWVVDGGRRAAAAARRRRRHRPSQRAKRFRTGRERATSRAGCCTRRTTAPGASSQGLRVLVVGLGNSGAEIAADLVEQGASTVSVAVRSRPPISAREIAGRSDADLRDGAASVPEPAGRPRRRGAAPDRHRRPERLRARARGVGPVRRAPPTGDRRRVPRPAQGGASRGPARARRPDADRRQLRGRQRAARSTSSSRLPASRPGSSSSCRSPAPSTSAAIPFRALRRPASSSRATRRPRGASSSSRTDGRGGWRRRSTTTSEMRRDAAAADQVRDRRRGRLRRQPRRVRAALRARRAVSRRLDRVLRDRERADVHRQPLLHVRARARGLLGSVCPLRGRGQPRSSG